MAIEVGVLGLGRMGTAIATRLLQCGMAVGVWNRTPSKALPLEAAGASVYEDAADLASDAQYLISSLADDLAIQAVYEERRGVLAGSLSDTLVIEMSTSRPGTQRSLATKVRQKGGAFVDCPVGGTVGPALAGSLLGFMGGEPADIQRADLVLKHLCRRRAHVGPVGAGSTVKLAINLPLAIYWQALGEAVSLTQHLNIDTELLIDLFAESSAGPNVLKTRGKDVALSLQGHVATKSTFDCALLRKDLTLMLAEAQLRGLELPVASEALRIYEIACTNGWSTRDGTEFAAFWGLTGLSMNVRTPGEKFSV